MADDNYTHDKNTALKQDHPSHSLTLLSSITYAPQVQQFRVPFETNKSTAVAPVKLRQLPQTAAQWRKTAAKAGLKCKLLKNCEQLQFGSQVIDEQYMLFRTVCKNSEVPSKFDPEAFGLSGHELTRAYLILQNHQKSRNYIKNLYNGEWLRSQELGVL